MMFKFNFLQEENEQDPDDEIPQQWLESAEIIPNNINKNCNMTSDAINIIELKRRELKYISGDAALHNLKDCHLITQIENKNSDLVTSIYEGGLKIWECTHDLLEFLSRTDLVFTEKNVLDLGCGAGLVGIYTAILGANVYFQDYNREVVEALTVPNCYLNNIIEKCKFYSGDWASFGDLINIQFDYILTSETIYNENNYIKLINLFKKLLKPDGVIYLAAKKVYFGVGGSLDLFIDRLKEKQLKWETCWECRDGVKRAIIQIKK